MSEVEHVVDCDNCGQPLDGTACRWRCTRCGFKLNCCEGAPLPPAKEGAGTHQGGSPVQPLAENESATQQ